MDAVELLTKNEAQEFLSKDVTTIGTRCVRGKNAGKRTPKQTYADPRAELWCKAVKNLI